MVTAWRAAGSLPDSRVSNVGNSFNVRVGQCVSSSTTGRWNWAGGQHRGNFYRPRVFSNLDCRYSNYAGKEGSIRQSSSRLKLTLTSTLLHRCSTGGSLISSSRYESTLGHKWQYSANFTLCRSKSRSEQDEVGEIQNAQSQIQIQENESNDSKRFGQLACWMLAVLYVGWLFILPYAPGDPVWAITPSTIHLITEQSLNFFYVLPFASILANAAGYHGLSAPVQHPMAEALFNLVIGWTLLFGPLLFTDRRRDRFGGSLEALWIIQMFLTNTVLAPYMAIRQNKSAAHQKTAESASPLKIVSTGMLSGAYYVGILGASVGLVSIFWAVLGRPGAGFGGLVDRWSYLSDYVRQERLAYAFVWDFIFYAGFQPWLIGDNLENIRKERRDLVKTLRAVPYVGLVAYLLSLEKSQDQGSTS